jgi:hypothetical protein
MDLMFLQCCDRGDATLVTGHTGLVEAWHGMALCVASNGSSCVIRIETLTAFSIYFLRA